MSQVCTHADAIAVVAAPRDVCEACIEIGGTWVNLRQCLTCGLTLCCNSSPNQHATAHNVGSGHPLIRSAMPGETWTWCYDDEAMVRETADGWETYDPFIETGILVAGQHAAAGGSFDLDAGHVTRQGFPLGEWAAYVREQHTAGDLDPRDAAQIDAIPGWRW
jgi:hypothetical protein